MKCKKARELIFLSREGERSLAKTVELERHIQSCPACAKEHVAANALNQRTSVLRETTPAPSDEAGLTYSIVRALRHAEATTAPSLAAPWTILFSPRFRFAIGMLMMIVGGIFLLQTDRDARRIAALEERLSKSTPSQTTIPGFRRAETFLPLTGSLQDLAAVIGRVFPGMARPGDAAQLTDSPSLFSPEAAQRQTTFGQFLLKKYPRLTTVRLDDGLDQSEQELLSTEGPLLLKDIETLIRKGELQNERH